MNTTHMPDAMCRAKLKVMRRKAWG